MKKIYLLFYLIIMCIYSVNAQNLLNNPESVVYDLSHDRYLVSNWTDGNIIQINNLGQQSYFNQVLESTAGLHIVGDTLFVSSNEGNYSGIVGFSLISSEIVFHVDIVEKQLLNDITSDNSGNLYVTDSEANKIYKIQIQNMSYTTLISSGLGYPNGIVYNKTIGSLFVLNGGLPNRPMISIDLERLVLTRIVDLNVDGTDGLTTSNNGNTYFSSWGTDKVYCYDKNFNNPPAIISEGHNNPADIYFNDHYAVLAIPNFNSNSIDFISIGGAVIRIPEDQPTIQAGIDNAINGDTILVNPGTYFENINFSGKNVFLTSNFHYTCNPEDIENTVINGSTPENPDSASCVIFCSGEGSKATLKGFTLRSGTGTNWIDPQFSAYTWHSGGGIFIFQSSPTIIDNYIAHNHCDDDSGVSGASGGGICMYGGNPLIKNNKITYNTAKYGGGVVIDYSGCIFRNNIVSNNKGGQSYGGAAFWTIGNGSEPVIIENNTIVYNETVGSGLGGAFYLWSTILTARNNIIWDNTQSSGGPVYTRDGALANINYSDIQGGYTGTGNINVDPDFENRNFILNTGSPCIDTGIPHILFNDKQDPVNNDLALYPSKGRSRNDMGVYGGKDCFNHNFNIISSDEIFYNMKQNNTIKCYPNPFYNFTVIQYTLNQPAEVEISIFDINGRKMKTLINSYNNKGLHSVNWDGSGDSSNKLPSGLYFYTLKVDNNLISSNKVILNY